MENLSSSPYAFLSYAREDAAMVDRIVDGLADQGIRLWRDIYDIPPGADWAKAIETAIDKAAVVLFVGSRHSAAAKFIVWKLNHFIERRGGAIIPVLIDDTPVELFPPFLQRYQFLDARNDFQSAILSIATALERFGLRPTGRPVELPQQANKGYVFVSYANEDLHYVVEVTQFFKQKGYAYFNYKDGTRRFDADFDIELEERLQSAALVTSIITPRWKKAVWPKKEYLFASKVGVPTFLLMFEDPGPSILIIDRTPIDFSADRKLAFEALDQELQRRKL